MADQIHVIIHLVSGKDGELLKSLPAEALLKKDGAELVVGEAPEAAPDDVEVATPVQQDTPETAKEYLADLRKDNPRKRSDAKSGRGHLKQMKANGDDKVLLAVMFDIDDLDGTDPVDFCKAFLDPEVPTTIALNGLDEGTRINPEAMDNFMNSLGDVMCGRQARGP